MEDCIFCKIIKGKMPCYKIYEDEFAIAVLDVFPNTRGQTLVISKEHYVSDISKIEDEELQQFVLSIKKVITLLKEGLIVYKVATIIEGVGINHIHAKLYPLYGLGEQFEPAESEEKVFYDKYPGFVDSRLGPKAKDKDLKEIASKVLDKNLET